MNPQTSENKTNYSYQAPIDHLNSKPNVVYIERQNSNNWWKYLLSCVLIGFILIACVCVLPIAIISGLSTQYSVNSNNTSSNIEEREIFNIKDGSGNGNAKIAVINITGEITYSLPGEAYSIGATSNNIISQLKKAKEDKDVQAILLRFNSPGGEVAAAEPICNEIKSINNKPVYSFIDSEGASLAFLLPNCTKYIYARESAITGSIGVIAQVVDFYGILERFGGKVIFVTNTEGKQKSGQDIFNPNSETYKVYQRILDETYDYFLDKVEAGRKINHPSISRDKLKEYADGRIFSGKQAKELDLVDEVGEFNETVNSIISRESNLKNQNISVVEYNILSNPFSNLLFGANSAFKSFDLKNNAEKSSGIKLLMESGVVNNSKTIETVE